MRGSEIRVAGVFVVVLALLVASPQRATCQSPFEKLVNPAASVDENPESVGTESTLNRLTIREEELHAQIKNLDALELRSDEEKERLNLLKLALSIVTRLKSSYEELSAATELQGSESSVEGIIKKVDEKGEIDTYYKYHKLEEQLIAIFGDINANQSTYISVKKLVSDQEEVLKTYERELRLKAEQQGKDNWEFQQLELRKELVEHKQELLQIQLRLAEESAKRASEQKVILEQKLKGFRSNLTFPLESLKEIESDLDAEVLALQQQLIDLEKRAKEFAKLRQQSGLEAYNSALIVAERFLRRHRDCLLAHIAFKEKERILWSKRYELHVGKMSNSDLHAARIRLGEISESMQSEVKTLNDFIVNGVKLLMSAESMHSDASWRVKKLSEKVGEIGREALSAITIYVGALSELLHLISIWEGEATKQLSGGGYGYYLWSKLKYAFSVFWDYELFALSDSPITPFKLIISLALFIGGIYLSRFLSTRFAESVLSRFNIETGVVHAAKAISYYLLIALFTVGALHVVHIPLTVFTLAGGALAIGIGFGSQNIVNNFFSGLILLFEQPIRVGDIIQFGQERGTVRRIGARSTIIVTPENHELVVPNSMLVEQNVLNYTLGDNRIRRSIFVGVAYGSETRLVNELLIKATAQHGGILKSPKAEVLFREFGDNALNFELRFWVTIRGYSEALRVESDLRHRINNLFNSAGIVVAFPQRDVHLNITNTEILDAVGAGRAGGVESTDELIGESGKEKKKSPS